MAQDSSRARVQATVERRRTPRTPVTVRIEYATVDAIFSEFTQNVNEGGLFIETDQPLEVEELVQLCFRLPGSKQTFRVAGRVAWVRLGSGSEPAGMGIEFENLDAEARAHINHLVRRLRVERS
jgi:type IV pilus assembly protein PilZ